jgi:5-deoxy-glucuronate isomerase
MSLRVRPRAPDPEGRVLEITPESAGWDHVGFTVLRLEPGQSHGGGAADREACIVILTGSARVSVDERDFGILGSRESVFDDVPPAAVYSPAGSSFRLTAQTAVEIAIGSAPGSPGAEPRLIDPDRMSREVRGQGTNQRFVRNILPENEPAHSLLVVEVITPGGHWSSYPPHKHDTATAGEESALEETYYHRLNPSQGFAFQRVYTDDRSIDEAITVEDGDVVMVPRGYHPAGAPHGYDLYYLNVMAGPKRQWIFRNDPQHSWIVGQG